MTVRQFMLKKFPTNKYTDCPVPQHHWETIQEYADQYAREVAVGFQDWTADNDYKPGSQNEHWYKWNGIDCEGTPYTTSELFDIFIEQNKKG
jgi:hypothetical protein